jgi:predicted RNA binding protein YcfA (HicA-like mRNA interferase family)
MRWPHLKRVLERRPLLYEVYRQTGSHVTMRSAAGYPDLHLAFHDRAELPPGLVRKILCTDVGLNQEDALALL